MGEIIIQRRRTVISTLSALLTTVYADSSLSKHFTECKDLKKPQCINKALGESINDSESFFLKIKAILKLHKGAFSENNILVREINETLNIIGYAYDLKNQTLIKSNGIFNEYSVNKEITNMENDESLQIFISHIHEETEYAIILKKYLADVFSDSVKIFVSSDDESIALGVRWFNEIENKISNSTTMLVLCSEESIKRPWINFEAGAFWFKIKEQKPLIPVVLPGFSKGNLPFPLSLLQAISINKKSDLKRLFEQIGREVEIDISDVDYSSLIEEVSNTKISYTSNSSKKKVTDISILDNGNASVIDRSGLNDIARELRVFKEKWSNFSKIKELQYGDNLKDFLYELDNFYESFLYISNSNFDPVYKDIFDSLKLLPTYFLQMSKTRFRMDGGRSFNAFISKGNEVVEKIESILTEIDKM